MRLTLWGNFADPVNTRRAAGCRVGEAPVRQAAVVALVAVAALRARCRGLAAPAQAQTDPVWSTTMTVGTSSLDAVGYTRFSGTSVLVDPDSFMIGVALRGATPWPWAQSRPLA